MVDTSLPTTPLREANIGMGIGASELPTSDMVLNIGPQHPSTHGVLRLALVIDGERIVRAEPIIGYMHRGHEKLFEVRDYRQIIVLANRFDWLSSFANEIGFVLGVERMMGLETPERALWIRTLMAELTRILNHLMFIGSYPLEVGAITPVFYAFREREALQRVMEEVSGGRLHYMFNRVGGLKDDLPAGWKDRCRIAVADVRKRMRDIERLILGNEIFQKRTVGVGVLTPDAVLDYGVTGPIGRASGVDFDLRRDEPYLKYGEVEFDVVTREAGDSYARFECLIGQVFQSLNIADQCLDRIPGGPVNVKLPKVVKAPEGHTYAWTENPLGINGYFIVSHGEKTPWRMRMRTASFNNIHALSHLLPGTLLPDLVAIMGSMFFVVGDVDK